MKMKAKVAIASQVDDTVVYHHDEVSLKMVDGCWIGFCGHSPSFTVDFCDLEFGHKSLWFVPDVEVNDGFENWLPVDCPDFMNVYDWAEWAQQQLNLYGSLMKLKAA